MKVDEIQETIGDGWVDENLDIDVGVDINENEIIAVEVMEDELTKHVEDGWADDENLDIDIEE